MALTVSELRDLLGQLEEHGLGDSELRFAYQANYPLQDFVDGIWAPSLDEDGGRDEEDEDTAKERSKAEKEQLVYLVSGGQEGYGPKAAFENCVSEL